MNVETFEEVTHPSIRDKRSTDYDLDHKWEEKCCN